jgi:glutathione S-transferase
MTTLKAFAAGSTCPPLAEGVLRVYSMRFCPYAQRTLLVLNHHKIPHEVVNINLKSKPEWYFAKNPLGVVPTLEEGNKLINESAICNEYLDEVYGKYKLLPIDPYARARAKMIMEQFSKVIEKFYVFYKVSTEEDTTKAVEEIRKPLSTFESKLDGQFFGGNEPSMIDFHIWPWFERFPTINKMKGTDILPSETFPKLNAWVKRMHHVSAVEATIKDVDLHIAFVKAYIGGGIVDFDIGLEE